MVPARKGANGRLTPGARAARSVSRRRGRLDGKVALVAGAGTGMGRAIAVLFAEEGADVVVSARSKGRIAVTAAFLREAGAECATVVADLASASGAKKAVAAATRAFGRLDLVVVSAGVYRPGTIDHTDTKAFDESLDANVRSHFEVIRAAIPALEKAGGGSIVTIAASAGGSFPTRRLLAYNTTKAAARALAENAAADLVRHNIRVNCILPGAVSHVYSPKREWKSKRRLTGVGTPEDIAHVALFLSSDEAAWITGAALNVDGGLRVDRNILGEEGGI